MRKPKPLRAGRPAKPYGAGRLTQRQVAVKVGQRVLLVSLDLAAEAALLALAHTWGIPDSTAFKRAAVEAAQRDAPAALERALGEVSAARDSAYAKRSV